MNANFTINSLKEFCTNSSGDVLGQIWENKGTTYHWNRGRDTPAGLVNGVVRKLAGIDASGKQIWVVAGSFKIDEHGTILRFTGLPKKTQKAIEALAATPIVVPEQAAVVV
jgi:hypothetical protein